MAMVPVPFNICLLAFLWLLEHIACSKAEEARPTLRSWSQLLLLSFCHPLLCISSCLVWAVHCCEEGICLILAGQQPGKGFLALRERSLWRQPLGGQRTQYFCECWNGGSLVSCGLLSQGQLTLNWLYKCEFATYYGRCIRMNILCVVKALTGLCALPSARKSM